MNPVDALDILIEPIYRTYQGRVPLDVALYTRPGRIIYVHGEHNG